MASPCLASTAFASLLAAALACRSAPEVPLAQAPPARAQPPASAAEVSVRPGANERFLDPALDVAEFVELFEGESREIATARDALVARLGLAPGQVVADVGAGTGLFLLPLAAAVGPTGKVWALDISPGFVEHMRRRVVEEELVLVEPRLCAEDSVGLPERSIDVAFVCDTYHHLEYPRSVLASLAKALRPGGTLVIVDFERIEGHSREWVLDHVRAGKDVVRAEVEAAGFSFFDEPQIEGLEENYVLRFRRP